MAKRCTQRHAHVRAGSSFWTDVRVADDSPSRPARECRPAAAAQRLQRGAADTLEALHHGASDDVTKPASAAGMATAQQRILEDLVPKIKSLCRLGNPVQAGQAKPNTAAPAAARPFALRAVGTPITAD